MSNGTKLSRLNHLVDRVRHCSHIDECSKSIKVQLCEGCNEVNLWTYWEGGRDRLDAEILLRGWGIVLGARSLTVLCQYQAFRKPKLNNNEYEITYQECKFILKNIL